MQSLEGPTPLLDHFQTYGTSVQHPTFLVSDVAQARQALVAKGGKWIMGHEHESYAQVDLKEQLGVTVELQTLKR